MTGETAPFNPAALDGEQLFEVTLRPTRFEQFVGQLRVVENLQLAIQAAQARGEPLDHILFSGLPGLGKTTLAYLVARSMDAHLHETSGPALLRAADLVGLLSNLAAGDLLFIDEIHRLSRPVEEVLYAAMEDYVVDVVLDQGPSARNLRLKLPRFTLIGATTQIGRASVRERV